MKRVSDLRGNAWFSSRKPAVAQIISLGGEPHWGMLLPVASTTASAASSFPDPIFMTINSQFQGAENSRAGTSTSRVG